MKDIKDLTLAERFLLCATSVLILDKGHITAAAKVLGLSSSAVLRNFVSMRDGDLPGYRLIDTNRKGVFAFEEHCGVFYLEKVASKFAPYFSEFLNETQQAEAIGLVMTKVQKVDHPLEFLENRLIESAMQRHFTTLGFVCECDDISVRNVSWSLELKRRTAWNYLTKINGDLGVIIKRDARRGKEGDRYSIEELGPFINRSQLVKYSTIRQRQHVSVIAAQNNLDAASLNRFLSQQDACADLTEGSMAPSFDEGLEMLKKLNHEAKGLKRP